MLIEEHHFDEIIGFWLDSPEVFLFSLKADVIKMKLLEDGTFGEAATEGGICACYSVEVL
jgi:hypothetical protein